MSQSIAQIPSAAPLERASNRSCPNVMLLQLKLLSDTSGKPLEIPLDKIERNPYQTRSRFNEAQLDELAQSIAASGVVQPIVVKKT